MLAGLQGRLHTHVALLACMATCPRSAVLRCMQGRLLASLEGHSKRVTGVAYVTPEVLVSSSADKTVRVWRGPVQGPGEFTCTHTLKDHTGEVSEPAAGQHSTTVGQVSWFAVLSGLGYMQAGLHSWRGP